ncbi:MAG: UDP-N-acetylmuramate--L-alanine ligase [Ignavibacteria bacterium]
MKIYFVGIGGIGMSGLAEYFLKTGSEVSGSDIEQSHITHRLEELGAHFYLGHSENHIDDSVDLVVYSSAIDKDNPEINKAYELNIKSIKRAELLGQIVNDKFLIAVSGTHGKTTTTAMLGKLLIDSGFDPLIFVGGNVSLFKGAASRFGKGNFAVVEADEYDRSFLTLKPDIAVITSIDEDHLDIYKDIEDIKNAFKQFCNNSKQNGKVVYCGDDKNISDFISSVNRENFSYGFTNDNYYRVSDYKVRPHNLNFSILNSHGSYKDISLNLIGKHNVLNSAACFAVSKILGIEFEKYCSSVESFSTVDRRLQLKYENKVKVYDDYAHHPKEIESSLLGLKEISKDKKIITVFQPHLFSRTRDFFREFAEKLAASDLVVLLEIYPAREKPVENVTSGLIHNELKKMNPDSAYISDEDEVIKFLLRKVKNYGIVLFQGAGDVTILCDKFIEKLKSEPN